MRARFIRLLDSCDKETDLRLLISANPGSESLVFTTELQSLGAIPGSPFAYWAPESLVTSFAELGRLSDRHDAMTGAKTNDDVRFIRLRWEVAESNIARTRELTHHDRSWALMTRGGRSTSFHQDVDSVVFWRNDGYLLKAYISEYRGSRGWGYQWSANLNGYDWYFRSGITWPLRGIRLATWAIPSGCLPSGAGKMAYAVHWDLLPLLAVTNSRVFDSALTLFAGRVIGVQYEAGLMQKVPFPDLGEAERQRLSALGRQAWSARRSLDTVVEVSHAFVVPALLQVDGESFAGRVSAWAGRVAEVEAELERVQFEIDELCFELYGISEEDRRAITEGFHVTDTDDESDDDADDEESDAGVELDPVGLAAGVVSWAVGVAVGRFDVRLATGGRDWPVEPDPFDPLPVCSPGMLTGVDGLPVTSLPAGYPLVPSPVLVDDPGHELDITARVRAVFDVVFGDDADIWWSDIGAALDTKNGVEGWLRRGFFDHHLKTYSKSRRKAPIMWPIGTKSGSYQVWLYAHSVTPDSVFRLLGDVIEPKLAAEQRQLSDLTQEFGPSPTASQRRTLDAQQKLVDEITELRDEIRAIAALWHPDLNDGIVIVLAPLWRLFAPHRAWAKELKDRWVKLAKGDYDWAQIAMHIWPERVIPKCATDRSLAIAHNLEEVFWAHDDTNPDKWHPRTTPTTPIDQLIADRTNPTITTTRNHPTP